MTTYSHADWARLGQAVHEARKECGLANTRQWAAAAGRSERMLLELERGGKVGSGTLERVEDALGWPRAGAYRVLGGLPWRDLTVAAQREEEPEAGLLERVARLEHRLDVIESRLEQGGLGDVALAAQKKPGVTRRPRRSPENLDENLFSDDAILGGNESPDSESRDTGEVSSDDPDGSELGDGGAPGEESA